jgi:hypothetical protein
MITPGRLAAGFFGVAAGVFLGRALFKWILGVEGTWLVVAVVAFAVIGSVLAVATELEKEADRSRARRDDGDQPVRLT